MQKLAPKQRIRRKTSRKGAATFNDGRDCVKRSGVPTEAQGRVSDASGANRSGRGSVRSGLGQQYLEWGTLHFSTDVFCANFSRIVYVTCTAPPP